MPYWEVPSEVLEDREQLVAWAERAYGVAQRAAAGKKR
jgi:TfoX/Sxy family transcriptional regulator of competence genes